MSQLQVNCVRFNLCFEVSLKGLDSKMAKNIVSILRDISREERIVVAVIHQPSLEVFEMFDSILVLKEGTVVYHGSTNRYIEYFEGYVKWNVSGASNPIENVFELLEGSKSNELEELWRSAERAQYQDIAYETADETLIPAKRNSDANQFLVLCIRSLYDIYGDKSKFRQRVIKRIFVNFILGLVFIGQADQENSSAFVVSGALFAILFTVITENANTSMAQYPLFLPIIVSLLPERF